MVFMCFSSKIFTDFWEWENLYALWCWRSSRWRKLKCLIGRSYWEDLLFWNKIALFMYSRLLDLLLFLLQHFLPITSQWWCGVTPRMIGLSNPKMCRKYNRNIQRPLQGWILIIGQIFYTVDIDQKIKSLSLPGFLFLLPWNWPYFTFHHLNILF